MSLQSSEQQRAFPVPICRLGIIGGGQLGRMMAMAADRIGIDVVVLDPEPECPAWQVTGQQIVGGFHDADKLSELVEQCDVTTYELENIDTGTLAELEASGHRILPAPGLLAIVQDKLLQKQLLHDAGIPTAEFQDLLNGADSAAPDTAAFAKFGFPLVQKARRGGYDGRGVAVMKSAHDLDKYLPVPALIERFIEADKELAIVVARSQSGQTVSYPVVEMAFRDGENVLDLLLAPADVDPVVEQAARELGIRTVEALDGVGVFAIEMFLTAAGDLLVNEVAPRVHNSGHHTFDACQTDQFEQHLRAVAGLPLGSTEQHSPAAMLNLLGEAGYQGKPVLKGLAEAMAIPGVCLHLYGKAQSKPFRKMGHVTVVADNLDDARRRAEQVRDTLIVSGDEKQ